MRPPISYYGGKQNMVRHILPIIPPHKIYCEPFFGGGAVFFAKKPAKLSVINDTNYMAINFYRVLKDQFPDLRKMVEGTLHSESEYKRAKELLKENKGSDIERAWAFWVQTNMSFGKIMFAGFAFNSTIVTAKKNKKGGHDGGLTTEPQKTHFRKARFKHYAQTLETAEIFNRDALNVIALKDTKETLHYIDPPYFNSDCGHYKGYQESDFLELLDQLTEIEGKFILSSYPSEILEKYRDKYGWQSMDIVQTLAVSDKRKESKKKTECLTFNFALESDKQQTLF